VDRLGAPQRERTPFLIRQCKRTLREEDPASWKEAEGQLKKYMPALVKQHTWPHRPTDRYANCMLTIVPISLLMLFRHISVRSHEAEGQQDYIGLNHPYGLQARLLSPMGMQVVTKASETGSSCR
jgi:hypothetical protein